MYIIGTILKRQPDFSLSISPPSFIFLYFFFLQKHGFSLFCNHRLNALLTIRFSK